MQMKATVLLMALAIVAGCTSVQQGNSLQGMPANAPVTRIAVMAQKYNYTPEVITVHQGDHVVLVIESQDVTHGFALANYGIEVALPPHKPVTVEFFAREAGTFPFQCSEFCGMGHFGMKGKVVVVPAAK